MIDKAAEKTFVQYIYQVCVLFLLQCNFGSLPTNVSAVNVKIKLRMATNMSAIPPPGMSPTSSSGQPPMSMETLIEKERALERWKAELALREREIQIALQRTLPNFPPKFLCIRPIFFHSIVGEVPSDRVRFVRLCYFNYYLICLILIFNFATAMTAFVASSSGGNYSWTGHMAASIPLLFGIIGAFLVWYYPIYKALSAGEGYVSAIVGTGVGFLFAAFMAVGVIGYGGCGWLFSTAVLAYKKGQAPSIMALICSVLWTIEAIVFFFKFFRVRAYSKEDGSEEMAQATAAARTTIGQLANAV